ncbi:MAG: tetratricopeptide repeat protein, partial [Candidatus Dadabacteria bacterium]
VFLLFILFLVNSCASKTSLKKETLKEKKSISPTSEVSRKKKKYIFLNKPLSNKTFSKIPHEKGSQSVIGSKVSASQFDKTVKYYEGLLRRKPGNKAILIKLASLYAGRGNYLKAASYLRLALANQPYDSEVHYKLGVLYEKAGHLRRALQEYYEAFRTSPSYPAPYYRAGLVYQALGYPEKAVVVWQKAIKKGALSAQIYSALAEQALFKNQLKRAEELLKQAVALDSSSFEAINMLGNLALKKGDLRSAITYWKKAVEVKKREKGEFFQKASSDYIFSGKSKLSPTALHIAVGVGEKQIQGIINKALNLIKKGQYKKAKPLLKRALDVDSNSLSALSLMGYVLAQEGDIARASAYWMKAVEIKKNLPEVTHNLSLALLALGRKKEAKAYLERLLSLNNTYMPAYITLSRIYINKGNLESAEKILNEALKIYSEQGASKPQLLAKIYNQLGVVKQKNGDIKRAYKLYKKALKADKNNPEALYNLGLIALLQEDYSKAIANFRRLVTENPLDELSRLNLAYAQANNGYLTEAIRNWRKVSQSSKNNEYLKIALNNLGVAYFLNKDFKKAEEYFNLALKKDPMFIPAIDNMAAVKLKLKDFNQAIKLYEQVVELDIANKEARKNLGALYLKIGKPEKALPHLQSAISLLPDDNNVLFNLASAHHLLGNRKEARLLYKEFLKRVGQNPKWYEKATKAENALRSLSTSKHIR